MTPPQRKAVAAPRFYALSALVARAHPTPGAAWAMRGAVRTIPSARRHADHRSELVAHFSGALHIVVTGAADTEIHWTAKTTLAEAR